MLHKRRHNALPNWEKLLLALPAAVFWKDRERRYQACNLQYAELLGYLATEDVIGFTDEQLLPDDIRLSEFYETDQSVLYFKKTINTEYGNCHSVKIPLENYRGDIIGIVGYVFDVSTYKGELEQAFRTLEEIIAVMPGHVYWKDRNCILQGCNEQQATDAGFSSRKMIPGKTAYDLLYQNQDEQAKLHQAAVTNSYDKKVMTTNKTMTLEEEVILANGSVATFLSKKAPLHDAQGIVTGLVGISFNITDRKRSEVLLKAAKEKAVLASKAKTEFLENMRHDIRTPLTGIVGFAELIADEAESPQIKTYASELVKATTALLEFQNEILDAIKVSSGQVSLICVSFDILDLLQKVLDLTRPKAVVKKLFLRYEIDETMPRIVMGDRKRLFRVLLELVTNALKFTNTGGVTVSLNCLSRQDDHLSLSLVVKDTGIGIPPDQFDSVFIRFNRLFAASEGVYEGSGLGLTIVNQFIKELSGDIRIESELGSGSQFTCTIPLLIAPGQTTQQHFHEKNVGSLEMRVMQKDPQRVLLIEDHEMTAIVNAKIFKKNNCVVTWVADAKQAQERYSLELFDLVVLDMGLPDSTGEALAVIIRDIDHKHGRIPVVPIIALTAHMDSMHTGLVSAGIVDAVYQKPLVSDVAAKIIATHSSGREQPMKTIDLDLGAKRICGDVSKSAEMLELLVRHIDSDYKALAHALVQQDLELIGSLIHRLLGALAYCGAPHLEFLCKTVQEKLKAGANQAALSTVQKVLDAICSLQKAWSDYLNSSKA